MDNQATLETRGKIYIYHLTFTFEAIVPWSPWFLVVEFTTFFTIVATGVVLALTIQPL